MPIGPVAARNTPPPSASIHTFSEADVLGEELRAINLRRREHGRRPAPADATDLVGLALSGGGIRSASVCLGVVQALDSRLALSNIDYLSTVSGGGYLGCCLTACLSVGKGKVPFNEENGGYGDTDAVRHIRDFSNYLIPRGFGDLVTAIGLICRGLAANVAIMAPAFATSVLLLLFSRPEVASLRTYGALQSTVGWMTEKRIPFVPGFPASTLIAYALLALLFVWAIYKSITNSDIPIAWIRRLDTNQPELKGRLVSIWKLLLLILAIMAWLELQPLALTAIVAHKAIGAGEQTGQNLLQTLLAAWLQLTPYLAPFAALATFLSRFLSGLSSDRKGLSARYWLGRFAAKLVLWLSAIILPSLLWLLYLEATASLMPAPDGIWKRLFYVLTVLALFIVLYLLNPNTTSLHRLYRDRLSKAFLFDPRHRQQPPRRAAPDQEGDLRPLNLKLHEIATKYCPFPIINAAINLQGSAFANRRGRNADFFEFTPCYTGSEATGWAVTKELESAEPKLDLGTALAISGAAISPNMGSATIRPLVPTLTLLNMRLGFWLRNPRFAETKQGFLGWLGDFRSLSLFKEMFGLINERSQNIYVTDGGNIENLGIHALLRRRCKFIVAVDAEADPGMSFGSLIKLERYARIDCGVLIDLPWPEVRTQSLAVDAAVNAKQDLPAPGPHVCVGTIRYGPRDWGTLVYMKASLTGDEADYIIDYKSRHPDFPHETTGDQFFGEEQLEAYRALGFHIARLFLDEEVPYARKPRPGETFEAAGDRIKTELRTYLGIDNARRPTKGSTAIPIGVTCAALAALAAGGAHAAWRARRLP